MARLRRSSTYRGTDGNHSHSRKTDKQPHAEQLRPYAERRHLAKQLDPHAESFSDDVLFDAKILMALQLNGERLTRPPCGLHFTAESETPAWRERQQEQRQLSLL